MTEDDPGEDAADEDPFADIEADDAADEDPFADTDEDPFADTDEDPFADIEGVEQEDDPFTDLSAGGDPSADFGPSDNTLFTDEGAAELDEEAVWERIEADDEDDAEPEATPELDPGTGPDLTTPSESDEEDRETVVKKRSYCEQCEYFSEPPTVACTYPDAEIVELVDTAQFRVRNCPIVARRRNNDLAAIAEGGGTADPEPESGGTADPELEVGDSGADD
jgi:hypothetical protein